MKRNQFDMDVAIVGGAGHVGLPLGLWMAHKNLRVCLYDTNRPMLDMIGRKKMPFVEYGADPILRRVLGKTLFLSSQKSDLKRARYVLFAVGTPVDSHLNPTLRTFLELIRDLKPHLHPDQTIIVRSTVFPGTCQQVAWDLGRSGRPWKIAYCPERIAQGYAIQELKELPQLVAGLTKEAAQDAKALFSRITSKVIEVSMKEAELAKLFSNAWRYIQFAVTNQFYMIAKNFEVNYDHVRLAMIDGYGRAAGLPSPGFAAGPCLMKDTMQLAAFNQNNFILGHAAMMINEGLPDYLVSIIRRNFDITKKKVGILGMAFKADVDDTRDSLSYKLGKILRFHGAKVFYSDEFAQDPTFVSKEKLVASCDIVLVGVPHSAYRSLKIPNRVQVLDLWGVLKTRNQL